MQAFLKNQANPNPITKFFAVVLLGFKVAHPVSDLVTLLIVIAITMGFIILGYYKDGVEGFCFYLIISVVPSFDQLASLPMILKMILSLLFVIKCFFLPFYAGKYFIKTSDVGSILASMDKLKVPTFFFFSHVAVQLSQPIY